MSLAALDAWLQRERARAAASFRLDDELGTQHGMSWSDFVLLHSLHDAGGAMADADLATLLGMLRSHLLLRVRPLEKIGLVVRELDGRGRRVVLSAGGRRLLGEARETASSVCAQLVTR